MATTPPPAGRLHTPPAPLHGSRYDAYEPYSPRRSSRVAAQRERYSQLTASSTDTSPPSRRQRATTPSNPPSSHAISPPSSPSSPFKSRSVRPTRRGRIEPAAVDSDSDQPTSRASRYLSAMDSREMLPTPAKTPRKRALQSQEALGSAARVLFANRPTNVDEAMPSPRKNRKSRKNAFSLESFEQLEEESEKIEIYTDSKERVPALDETEDNPFVTKKTRATNGQAEAGSSRRRKLDSRTERMEEDAANDEGLIYVFRGRKIFRKFDNGPPSHGSDPPDHSGDELRHKAGAEASRRLTRSTIKPRLLWPTEEQRRQREMGPDDVDEEAPTDIEEPIATPKKTRKGHRVVTPVKLNFTPASPPPTGRATRVKKQPVKIDEEADTPHASAEEEVVPTVTTRSKKTSPFDSWLRVKSGGSRGSKREGSPLESSAKRTRSSTSHVASNSAGT